jgi:hypothetical protein
MTMDNYDKKQDLRVSNPGDSGATTIAIIVAALVLAVGAFLYFGNSSTVPDGPQLTQNNAAPAPITEPATPLPSTPPAVEPTTPPVTPPADAPAANP